MSTGTRDQLKKGSIIRNGVRGSVFYRIFTSDLIDGGISPVFPDTPFWNNSTTVAINDVHADLKYIISGTIPERPLFGDGEFTGITMRLNVTDLYANSDLTGMGYKGLLIYKLNDLPVTSGAMAVSNDTQTQDTDAGSAGQNAAYDLMVYSDSMDNCLLKNPVYDFTIDFSTVAEKEFDNFVRYDATVIGRKDPYIIFSDVYNGLFEGYNKSELRKHVKEDPHGRDVIFLHEGRHKFQMSDIEYICRDGAGLWGYAAPTLVTGNKDEWEPLIHYSTQTDMQLKDWAYSTRSQSRNRSHWAPSPYSMIKSVRENVSILGTFDSDGNVDGGDSSVVLCEARTDAGSGYSMKGGTGLHMYSTWKFDDGFLPKLANETTTSGHTQRAITQIQTTPLPVPKRIASNFFNSSTGDNHNDTWNASRIEIILKVNAMTNAQLFHADNLQQGTANRIGLERGLHWMMSEKELTEDQLDSTASVTGHLFDHHDGLLKTNAAGSACHYENNSGVLGGTFISNYNKLYFVPWTFPAGDSDSDADPLNDDTHNWECNMKIDRHTNWYEDWTDGSTETHVMVREGDAGAFPDEFKSAHSIELPFGTFIKMSVIIDNPEDKFVTVVFSNASNDAFIGKTHIANGVDVTNNDLPLMSLLDRWPMYTSLTLCNTHCDVSDGSTETTHTEAGAGGHGLGPNAKVDSEISVFVDSIKACGGFASMARNASTRWENMDQRGKIDIKSQDILTSRGRPDDGDQSAHSSFYPYKLDDTYKALQQNMNTLVIGHETYKSLLGDTSSLANNSKAAFWLNGFRKNNAMKKEATTDSTTNTTTFFGRNLSNTDNRFTAKLAFSTNPSGSPDDELGGGQMNHTLMTDNDEGEIDEAEWNFGASQTFGAEGFTQKGGIHLDWDEENNTFTSREHIHASCAILKMLNDKEFIVTNPRLLSVKTGPNAANPTYRLYKYFTDQGDSSNYEEVEIASIDYTNSKIKLTKGVGTFITEETAPRYMISPKAFWITYHFMNIDSSDNPLANVSYDSLFGFITDTSTPTTYITTAGFTFNESQLTDSFGYSKKWMLDPKDDEGSIENNIDYGYGAISDSPKKDEKAVVGNVGYIQKVPVDETGAKYADLYKVVEKDDTLQAGAKVGFYVDAAIENRGENEITIGTLSNSTLGNKPILLAEYFDEKPKDPELSVRPFEEDPFYPEFEWTAPDGDLWYGVLHIDNSITKNQYDGAIFHLRLDDEGVHGADVTTAPTNERAAFNSDSGAVTLEAGTGAGKPQYHCEGISGNCYYFPGDSDDAYIRYRSGGSDTSGKAFEDLLRNGQASWVFHVSPDPNTDENIAYIYDSDHMSLYWQKTGSFTIGGVSHNTGTEGRYVAVFYDEGTQLTSGGSTRVVAVSTPTIEADGETFHSIIITFDKELKESNIKMYMNGEMVSATGQNIANGTLETAIDDDNIFDRWPAETDLFIDVEDVFIGNSHAKTNAFMGKMNEIVVYNKVIYPISPGANTFVLKEPRQEVESDGYTGVLTGARSYTARLFMKDYHNVIGSTVREVATSAPVQFRKSIFRINTG